LGAEAGPPDFILKDVLKLVHLIAFCHVEDHHVLAMGDKHLGIIG